jgi:hypothetical protein
VARKLPEPRPGSCFDVLNSSIVSFDAWFPNRIQREPSCGFAVSSRHGYNLQDAFAGGVAILAMFSTGETPVPQIQGHGHPGHVFHGQDARATSAEWPWSSWRFFLEDTSLLSMDRVE